MTLYVTDDNGCIDSLTKVVEISDGPFANYIFRNHCHRDSILFVDQSTNGAAYWQWQFGDGTTSNLQNPNHLFNNPGNFDVELIVTDTFGCVNSITKNVQIDESPSYSVNPQDTTVVMGEYVQITTSGGIQHVWSPSTGLDDSTLAPPIAQPWQDQIYRVQTLTDDTCQQIDTVIINISDDFTLFMPNAFSPNNDGKNDFYKIGGLGILEMHLQIYNRFGELVFETQDKNELWDGSFNGKTNANTSYRYKILVTYYNGQIKSKQGSITLLN